MQFFRLLGGIAVMGMASAASGSVLYLNTFDASGNVGLGNDPTDGTFFNSVSVGSATVQNYSTGPFVNGSTSGAAAGNYVLFDVPAAAQSTFATNNRFASVTSILNAQPAGESYNLGVSLDLAGEGRVVEDFAINTTAGRYDIVYNDVGYSSTNQFATLTGNVTLSFTSGTSNLSGGVLPAGGVTSVQLTYWAGGSWTTADGQFAVDNIQITGAPAPEPASLAVLALGAGGLLMRRRPRHTA